MLLLVQVKLGRRRAPAELEATIQQLQAGSTTPGISSSVTLPRLSSPGAAPELRALLAVGRRCSVVASPSSVWCNQRQRGVRLVALEVWLYNG